jgi:predicted homoserine dehydrogenase-like protein
LGQRVSLRHKAKSIAGANCASGVVSVAKKPMKCEMCFETDGISVVNSQCTNCRVEMERKTMREKMR